MTDQEEYEVEALAVEVSSQPIELYKVLKIANAVSGGGEAKFAISEGYVAVNGELEQRKRRKLYDGDVIEFNQEFYVVIFEPESAQTLAPQEAPTFEEPAVEVPSNEAKPASSNKAAKAKNKGKTSPKANSGSKAKNKPAGNKGGSQDKASAQEQPHTIKDQKTGRGGISF